MIDRDGVRHFRWITRGGCQVTGRIFLAHRDLVVAARLYWDDATGKVRKARPKRTEADPNVLPLRRQARG